MKPRLGPLKLCYWHGHKYQIIIVYFCWQIYNQIGQVKYNWSTSIYDKPQQRYANSEVIWKYEWYKINKILFYFLAS